MKDSRELGMMLANPGYSQPQRQAAVDAAASALRLSPLTVNFLRLLMDRQRGGDLAAIVRSYRAMVDQQAGRVRATLISAGAPGGAQVQPPPGAPAPLPQRPVSPGTKNDPS